MKYNLLWDVFRIKSKNKEHSKQIVNKKCIFEVPSINLTASMLAVVRNYCMFIARKGRILALVFGLCRWSVNFGRLKVVYHRIAQMFPFKFGLRRSPRCV
jgi:hypothetical protein